MNIVIKSSSLNGIVKSPPSKSVAHRAIICASLANDTSTINNISFSKDILATINGVEKIGANVTMGSSYITISKKEKAENLLPTIIDCSESGSTLRFLIPVVASLLPSATFTGSGMLIKRPINAYYSIFEQMGIRYDNTNGGLPLKIQGDLKSGVYKVPGNVSSQFVSGLLFALPLLTQDSKIIVEGILESKSYVDVTLDVLGSYGINVKNLEYREFVIAGNQKYISKDYTIEGDYSQAAFFLVGGIISGNITVKGLKKHSLQGDSIIIDIISKMGGHICEDYIGLHTKSSHTQGITIDASECPDLVPILAVLASLSKNTTNIINASRLRIKESDRLTAISQELKKLGADIKEEKDGLTILGKDRLLGGVVNSWNDHRIAMSLAIAALRSTSEVTITGAECVNKSYPNFWEDFKKIGGNIYEQHMG